jgi:dTDP-4-dehydrorhamnose reductase
MLRLASERDVLSVIDDQMGTPTDAAWLADMTAVILKSAPHTGSWREATEGKAVDTLTPLSLRDIPPKGGTKTSGVYHATAAGEVSWYGYASYLIARARAMGFPIKVSPGAIRAVASEAFPTPAQRPHNSRLDCSKLTATFGITPPPWQQGIDQLLEHLKP